MTADLRAELQETLGTAYTLERELGGGGMARLFLATENALGRPVVVKVLGSDQAASISADRFTREIMVAARLQDPHIVPVLSAGEVNGLPYYTMPFAEGDSLRARLTRDRTIALADAVRILRDVAAALEYAHARGIVHRDIKPENVLLAPRAAVVTDFGIAKALAASVAHAPSPEPGATLTHVGLMLGTPAYMSPEQAAGDPVDARTDLYAWGIIAYELLSGQHPFGDRTSAQALIAAHIAESPQALGSVHPSVPRVLADLVMQTLAKQPADRPGSAAHILAVLDSVTPDHAAPGPVPYALRGRAQLLQVLGVYVAAVLAIALLARLAVTGIGLPEWVFPGALVVMALGLPVILLTALAHRYAGPDLKRTTASAPPVHRSAASWLARRVRRHVSWRRTALGGAMAVVAFMLLVAGYMTLRALGIGPAGSLLAAGTLAPRERLLVADFHTPSADSALGAVIAEAVRTNLMESRVIQVIPTSTVAATLERMRRQPFSRLDDSLAREVAIREGAKGIVGGDLTPLGSSFVVTLRLVAAQNGDEFTSFRETIDDLRDLVPAIDRLSRKLRGKIGESLKSVNAAPRLQRVTTTSLEALRKYTAGQRANEAEGDLDKAIALLQEAVAIDTTFAMAYRKLAQTYSNRRGSDGEAAVAAYRRAYQHRDQLPEGERLLAIGEYFRTSAGHDRPRAAVAYEAALELDSLDYNVLVPYALLLRTRRDLARSEIFARRAVAANRDLFYARTALVIAQVNQGKFAEAAAAVADAAQRFNNHPRVDRPLYLLYAAQRQYDSAAIPLRRMRASRDNSRRDEAMQALASLDIMHGRLTREARDFATSGSARSAPALLERAVRAARIDIVQREMPVRGRARLDSALHNYPLRSLTRGQASTLLLAVSLYAEAGDPTRPRGPRWLGERCRHLRAGHQRACAADSSRGDRTRRGSMVRRGAGHSRRGPSARRPGQRMQHLRLCPARARV